jgi:hypothetical protein
MAYSKAKLKSSDDKASPVLDHSGFISKISMCLAAGGAPGMMNQSTEVRTSLYVIPKWENAQAQS